PCYSTVLNILRDPVYAGAYRYGKSATRSVIREGRLRKLVVQKPLKDWSVLIPNRHEGYISWDQFEQVSHIMTNNSQKCFASGSGAPKKGLALLVDRADDGSSVLRKAGPVIRSRQCDRDGLMPVLLQLRRDQVPVPCASARARNEDKREAPNCFVLLFVRWALRTRETQANK